MLPDQVLPQKIHFVMRGCRQQHLKAKAFLFGRVTRKALVSSGFLVLGGQISVKVYTGKIKVQSLGAGKGKLSGEKMCTT